jgi:hypothetical protein
MRAAYHLAFAVFSLGTVATPTAAPNATSEPGLSTDAARQHAVLEAVTRMAADLSTTPSFGLKDQSALRFNQSAAVGETLPETIELHPIPRHETYRYAVMNDHRVIVDAASRKVVYVIR